MILLLVTYRNQNTGAVLSTGLSGSYSYGPALRRREQQEPFLLSSAQESDFLVPNELVAQPTSCSGHPLRQRDLSVILIVFHSVFIVLAQRTRSEQNSDILPGLHYLLCKAVSL